MTADPSASITAAQTVVVDASVAVKWVLTEDYSAKALRLLSGSYRLVAPDLIFSEAGNVLWKRTQRGEMEQTEAAELLGWLLGLPIELYAAAPLLPAALEIACQCGRSVYDSLYLALSVRENAKLVTADERLCNSLLTTPLSSFVHFVADVTPE